MRAYIIFFLTTAILLAGSQSVGAQGSTKRAAAILLLKKRKLILIRMEEDKKLVEKLTRKHPEQAAFYKQAIADLNENFKKAVAANWPYSSDIVFKTYEEALAISKSKSKSYAVLQLLDETMIIGGADGSHVTTDVSLNWNPESANFENNIPLEQSNMRHAATILVSIIENLQTFSTVRINLPHQFPTAADLYFGIQYLSWYVSDPAYQLGDKEMNEAIKANDSQLKNLTLIIDENDLDQQLQPEAIKTIYTYPVRVVDHKEFENIVTSKSDSVAYLCIATDLYQGVNYTPMVIKAATGIPVYIDAIDAGDYVMGNLTFGRRGNPLINEKVIEKMVKELNSSR